MARGAWNLLLFPVLVVTPLLCMVRWRLQAWDWAGAGRLSGAPVRMPRRDGGAALESWVREGLKVYLYDAAALRPVAREVFGEAAWWSAYEAWSREPSTFPWANSTSGDAESPGAFIFSELRRALEARAPAVEIVDSPDSADLVLWNVWDVALCQASGHQALAWELQKGRLSQSCPAHFALLAWLQRTPRWRRNHGRDHVLYVDSPYSWESYLDYTPEWKLQQTHALPPFVPDQQEVRGITRNATMIGIEERRLPEHRGSSSFVAVPYFASTGKYQAPLSRGRSHLVGFAASSVLNNYSACEVCSQMPYGPTEIRARIFEDLRSGCTAGECEVYDLTEAIGADQRNNLTFYASAGVDLGEVVHDATFCPIPRGDSGCTKRLFAAILGGCIPVILSDSLVLPFASAVDYRGAMLRVPEAQLMSPGFSLLALLRSQTPQQTAALRAGLARVRGAISYRPGAGPAVGTPGRRVQGRAALPRADPDAMDFLVASLARRARRPREDLAITAAGLYGSEPVMVTTPLM